MSTVDHIDKTPYTLVSTGKMKSSLQPEVHASEHTCWRVVWRVGVVLMTIVVLMLLCDLMTSFKYSLDVLTSDPEVFKTGSRNVTTPVMFNSFRTFGSYFSTFVRRFAVCLPFGS